MKRWIASLLFVCTSSAFAQSPNLDSIFNEAQKASIAGDFGKSIALLKQLRSAAPEVADYQLTLGRVYSWNKNYSEASTELIPLASKVPPNAEAMEALLNVLLWSENFESLLTWSDKALLSDSVNVTYRLRKVQALEHFNRDEEALAILERILDAEPRNNDALYLRTIIWQKSKNAVTVSYQNTSFKGIADSTGVIPGFSPHHFAFAQYKRQLEKSAILGRVTWGHMYQTSAALFEVDYYPQLGKRSYLYTNAGFSTAKVIFPTIQLGAELYQAVAQRWEFSLGARYLQFDTTGVVLFTGSLTRGCKGSWQPVYRMYASIHDGKFYPSHLFSLRKTNEIKENYVQLDIHYGTIPYNTTFNVGAFDRVSAFRAGLQAEFRIGGHFFLRPVFMYEYEEYFPDKFRNRYNGQLILTKRF